MEPNERDLECLVKALVKAHNQALDYFRRGAAAAKKAGEYLHALMKIRDFKTREAVWRFVLDSSDLTEETSRPHARQLHEDCRRLGLDGALRRRTVLHDAERILVGSRQAERQEPPSPGGRRQAPGRR